MFDVHKMLLFSSTLYTVPKEYGLLAKIYGRKNKRIRVERHDANLFIWKHTFDCPGCSLYYQSR